MGAKLFSKHADEHALVLRSDMDKGFPPLLYDIGPPRTELEWLHHAEGCPIVRYQICKTAPPGHEERLLSLWIALGRPNPKVLRQEVLAQAEAERNREVVELLGWSWDIINRDFAPKEEKRENR